MNEKTPFQTDFNQQPDVEALERQGLRNRLARRIGKVALRLRGIDAAPTDYGQTKPMATEAIPNTNDRLEQTDPEAQSLLEGLFQAPGPLDQLFVKKFGKSERVASINFGDEPFEIPTGSIVSAPGLESWNDTEDQKDMKYVRRNVAKGKQIDPVSSELTAYVQPNGHVMYALANNGAHSALTAIHRGDTSLKVNGSMSVRRLERDIVDSDGAVIDQAKNPQPQKTYRDNLFVKRSDSTIESGWAEIGEKTVQNGIEYTRVMRADTDANGQEVLLSKRVPTIELNQLQDSQSREQN